MKIIQATVNIATMLQMVFVVKLVQLQMTGGRK